MPESGSVTLTLKVGVPDVRAAPEVGERMLTIGLTVSRTLSLREFPSVASVESTVAVLPAMSSAVTETG